MKIKIIILIIIFNLFIIINCISQTVNWDWAKHAGGGGDDIGYSITTNKNINNNVIIVGYYNNTACFDTILLNSINIYGSAFLTVIDTLGNFKWAKRMVGTNSSYFHSVASDILENIYVAGSFAETIYLDSLSYTSNGSADIVIAKYNSGGVLQWAKSAGGIGLDAGVSITCSDSLLFVGGEFRDSVYFDSTLLISKGNSDIFLACLDFDGNYQWIKSAGGTSYDVPRSITIDYDTNIILSGIVMNNASFGETDTSVISYGSSDAFVAKYDYDGGFHWVKSFGGIDEDRGISVISDSANNLFLHGYFYGTAYFDAITLTSIGESDYFISKLSPNGSTIWAKKIGATVYPIDDFWNHTLESDEQGNIYITGWFMDSLVYDSLIVQSNGSYDIFVMKIDNDGNLIWCLTAGNNHSYGDYSRSIAGNGNGSLYITGRFYSTLFFDDSEVTSYGSADVFIAKISETPLNVEFVKQTMKINIFPNPANNEIQIISDNNAIKEVEIINIKGECVSKNNQTNLNYIDVSKLTKGVYFVRVIFTNMTFTKKIIII
ncbi:MAG: T9SS type A sorting domain-containing protein [Bacteroidota bacterium]